MRLAVIGSGVMGTNHIRVAQRTNGVELVAIVEPDAQRRAVAIGSADIAGYGSVDELISAGGFDSAVVASPTAAHHQAASVLIAAGKHVLVEKPFALTIVEAEDLSAQAIAAGVTLTVGHIERFNAAFRELLNNIENPIHVTITRSGPFSPRVLDNVVTDLMIHDLDLVSVIAHSDLVDVRSVLQTTRTNSPDLAVALLTFASGLSATVMASRIGQQKVRSIEVTQNESVVVADLLKQEVLIHRLQQVEFVSSAGARIRHSGMIEVPMIENRGEPLMQELTAFAAAVNGAPVVVSPLEAIRAMRLTEAVLTSALTTC
jgi:predicted dehydrogenase